MAVVTYRPTGVTWERYVLSGEGWRVCPACAHRIAAQDAQELARDRRDMLHLRIEKAVTLAIMLAVIGLAVARDISVLSAPHRPYGSTHPSIAAPR